MSTKTTSVTSARYLARVPAALGRRVRRRVPVSLRVTGSALARALRLLPPIRVSVVVATFNSDPQRLDRLMRSVFEQTMSARHIEVVLVDDGSTDDTVTRLRSYARRHPNVLVRSLSHSGWAGRPRNVGTRIAHGSYVLYMDHDDVLFPRALERAYAFGRAHRADVVNAKEVRTSGWSWGWDAFVDDVPLAHGIDPNPLIPMTPHKLYRRRFLQRHRLRFREGARVFWEDIYFNLGAFTHGARVAVLSSTPFYHWVSTGENNSDSYSRPDAEYWANLEQLLAFHVTELADVPGGPEQITHQIRTRVLPFVGPRLLHVPDADADDVFGSARALAATYAAPERDDVLPAVQRSQLEILRRGDLQQQRLLAGCDDGVTAVPVLDGVTWDRSELVVSVSTTLTDAAGAPLRLRRVGTSWTRLLPIGVAADLSPQSCDVTRDLERATFVVSVKGRTTRSTWALPGHADVRCTDDGSGHGVLRARVVARFDPVAFAAAHDLQADAVFDFGARFQALGYVVHRAVRGGSTCAALVEGVASLAYENQSGALSLDVDAARSLARASAPDPASAVVSTERGKGAVRVDVRLPLPDVHCVGRTSLAGQVVLPGLRLPATLVAEAGHAVLRFSGPVPVGEHEVSTRFNGRTGPTGLVLSAGERSAALVTQA